jgi:hypothetical protein
MPQREVKLYPSTQNFQRVSQGAQDAWPWVNYVHSLLHDLTESERASAKVVAEVSITYLKEVPQEEIDRARLRIVLDALNGVRPGEGLSPDTVTAVKRAIEAV